MAIDYDWTCTICGASNTAGTTNCHTCGADASNSAWSERYRWPPASAVGNSVLAWCGVALGGALFLARSVLYRLGRPLTSIPTAWYLAGGLVILSVIVLWTMGGLRRRK
jgi:hypothetical protein